MQSRLSRFMESVRHVNEAPLVAEILEREDGDIRAHWKITGDVEHGKLVLQWRAYPMTCPRSVPDLDYDDLIVLRNALNEWTGRAKLGGDVLEGE
jgi:hypothetical protein